MIKLNNTPVRTSRNFNINNISLDENIIFCEKLNEFKNLKICSESNQINITENIPQNIQFKYGLEDKLNKEIFKLNNKVINMDITSTKNDEVILDYNLDNNDSKLYQIVNINVKENAIADVIIKFRSEEETKGIVVTYLNVNMQIDSKLNITIVNLLGENIYQLFAIQNNLDISSKLDYNLVDFGGQNVILNYYSNLFGKETENNINSIYLGNKNQMLDFNYICELNAEKSKVNIDVKGALDGESKKHFKGTLDFKKGAKGSIGNEDEFCYILSNNAKTISLPMLLCREEQIEGNHASASGKIDEKLLFYLMSRGFTEKEALKIIIKAKFNKTIENIQNEKLREEIIGEIDKKLK